MDTIFFPKNCDPQLIESTDMENIDMENMEQKVDSILLPKSQSMSRGCDLRKGVDLS